MTKNAGWGPEGRGSTAPPAAELGELFVGSATRHGTHSGFSKHVIEGTEPCQMCKTAKADYDYRWRLGDVPTRRNRLRAKAQGLATTRLRRKYAEEYDEEYKRAVAEVFEAAGMDPGRLGRRGRVG